MTGMDALWTKQHDTLHSAVTIRTRAAKENVGPLFGVGASH